MTHPITEENLEGVLEEGGISMDLLNQLFSKDEIAEMIEEANKLNEPQYYFRSWVSQAAHEGACDSESARNTTDWDWRDE